MSIYTDTDGKEHRGEGNGTFGIALLSRFPIEEQAILEFGIYDEESDRSARNALGVMIRPVEEGAAAESGGELTDPLWLVNVHLGCDFGGSEQLHQAQLLMPWLGELTETGASCILIGDFNCLPHFAAVTEVCSQEGLYGAWRDNWSILGSGLGLTFKPGWIPLFRLDYMFSPEGNPWQCESMEVISGKASDHSALAGRFVQRITAAWLRGSGLQYQS
eukprot:TRINITY_DN21357_c0_g1_i2.p1 TRINITY_DN21357_c0_g1~~TRINITY_DN21357_c0_g1_i2.p1  ORF type:complete len:218 (-),score=35.32 TRINITY_DN21357_c0_g1_i2:36-689(-)